MKHPLEPWLTDAGRLANAVDASDKDLYGKARTTQSSASQAIMIAAMRSSRLSAGTTQGLEPAGRVQLAVEAKSKLPSSRTRAKICLNVA